MSQAKSGLKSAGILVLVAIVSKILGFLREEVIAYRFGASYLTDAYYVASIIPLMLFSVVNGALRQTLIPIFVEYLHQKGKPEAYRFANVVFNVLMVILLILIMVGYFGAPFLIKMVAPGFSGKAYTTAVGLTEKLIFLIIFLGLAGIASGILNSLKDFKVPAVASLPQNVIIILCVLILGKTMGITGLAIGAVLGAASNLFLQFPAIKKHGLTWQPVFDLRHPGLRKMGLLVVPIFIGTSVNQLNVLVDRILASSLPEGSISALNFANKLSGLPLGLFTLAVSTVLFPVLAECAADESMAKFKETIFTGIKAIVLFTVPIAVGLLVLRVPIVQLLFQRGAFDVRDTQATAFALAFYTLGIVAISLREIMNKVYFSLQDTRLPVTTGIIGLVLNIILNLCLVRYLAQGGLALGTSMSSIINVSIMFYYLPKKIGKLNYVKELGPYLGKVLAAAVVMGLAVWGGNVLFPNQTDSTLSFQLLKVGGLILTGVVVYFGVVIALGVEELKGLKERFGKRISRQKDN